MIEDAAVAREEVRRGLGQRGPSTWEEADESELPRSGLVQRTRAAKPNEANGTMGHLCADEQSTSRLPSRVARAPPYPPAIRVAGGGRSLTRPARKRRGFYPQCRRSARHRRGVPGGTADKICWTEPRGRGASYGDSITAWVLGGGRGHLTRDSGSLRAAEEFAREGRVPLRKRTKHQGRTPDSPPRDGESTTPPQAVATTSIGTGGRPPFRRYPMRCSRIGVVSASARPGSLRRSPR
jgi:hypothetical protein